MSGVEPPRGSNTRLHDRWLNEPRYHAVTQRLRNVLDGVLGRGSYTGDELLAYAEAIDVLYQDRAHPAAAEPLPDAIVQGVRGGIGFTFEGIDYEPVDERARAEERERDAGDGYDWQAHQ